MTILEQAIVIRDETQEHANTPSRVGQCLVDIAEALPSGGSFNPGPIDMPQEASFYGDERPAGTPVWRTWLITREMFSQDDASTQDFALVNEVIGLAIHAAKIDVNWQTSSVPIQYGLYLGDGGETLMSGENIFDTRPPLTETKISPDDATRIIFNITAQSGTLLDAVSGFMNIQISILVSGPAPPLPGA